MGVFIQSNVPVCGRCSNMHIKYATHEPTHAVPAGRGYALTYSSFFPAPGSRRASW